MTLVDVPIEWHAAIKSHINMFHVNICEAEYLQMIMVLYINSLPSVCKLYGMAKLELGQLLLFMGGLPFM